MKLKALSLSIAVAVSAPAFAFNPNVTTPDYNINLSGATASTKTTRQITVENICDSTASIDVFDDATGEHWAVACKTKAAYGGQNVLFRKYDGGSGTGAYSVDEMIPVPLRDMSACASASSGTATVGTTTVNAWSCGTNLINDVPDIGFSDVEPGLFKGDLKESQDFKNVSNMTVRGLSGLVFGVNVTTDLRNALQAAQGLSVGAEDEANMPSLSTNLVRSLFTGKVKSWDQVGVDDGAGNFVDLVTLASNNSLPTPASNTVFICRRAAGSGTLAQIAVHFLGTNCSTGTGVAPARMVDGTSPFLPFLQPQVSEPTSSGKMDTCLNNLGSGGTASYGVTPGVVEFTSGAVNWGVGFQSTEKNADLSKAYRFVKIDGFAPTLKNVHAGKYFDFAESSIQVRGGANSSWNSTVPSGQYANAFKIFNAYADTLAQNSFLIDLNADGKFAHSWGQGGWLANPEAPGNVPDAILDLANPVNTMSHVGANHCQGALLKEGAKILVD